MDKTTNHMFKIRVEIKEIWQTETFASGFEKRIAVVQSIEQFPQIYKMEFTQNNVNLLDEFNSGELVYIKFNIKGNKITKENKDMYFQSLNAWKISRNDE